MEMDAIDDSPPCPSLVVCSIHTNRYKASLWSQCVALIWQVTPREITQALLDAAVAQGATMRIGTVQGVRSEETAEGLMRVTGVVVDGTETPADAVCGLYGDRARVLYCNASDP
jgi:hypothetical protein